MKRFMMFGLCLVFVMAATTGAFAQEISTQQALEHLVQTPVAVDKVVEAGGSADQVSELARSLNEGLVDPATFNEIMSKTPEMASHPEGITGVGTFVTEQVEAGLTGEDLALATREHLRTLGIPAGGNTTEQPPPIAENYIPSHVTIGPAQQQPETPQRPDIGPDNRPGPGNLPGGGAPSGVPGGVGGGPTGGSGPPTGVGR